MGKLVRNVLVGQGITVRNIIYRGDTGAIAIFDGTNSNLGLDSGVLISTGKAIDAIGPNNLQVSSSNNKGGDVDLNTIAGGITVDAASLQFDFIPVTNSIKLLISGEIIISHLFKLLFFVISLIKLYK